jgi:hypothetical protein
MPVVTVKLYGHGGVAYGRKKEKRELYKQHPACVLIQVKDTPEAPPPTPVQHAQCNARDVARKKKRAGASMSTSAPCLRRAAVQAPHGGARNSALLNCLTAAAVVHHAFDVVAQ